MASNLHRARERAHILGGGNGCYSNSNVYTYSDSTVIDKSNRENPSPSPLGTDDYSNGNGRRADNYDNRRERNRAIMGATQGKNADPLFIHAMKVWKTHKGTIFKGCQILGLSDMRTIVRTVKERPDWKFENWEPATVPMNERRGTYLYTCIVNECLSRGIDFKKARP